MTSPQLVAADEVSMLMTGHTTLKVWELTSPTTFAVLPLTYLHRLRRERARQQSVRLSISLNIVRLDALFGFMQKQFEK